MLRMLLRDRISAVWILLMGATVLSWRLGLGHGIDSRVAASAVVIVVAFVKVYLVGRYFMEIRNAPVALRRL